MVIKNSRSTTGPNKPKDLAPGTALVCMNTSSVPGSKYKGPQTITEDMLYIVKEHVSYCNTYGKIGNKHSHWDEFVVIENDYGNPVKVNLNRFQIFKNRK